MKKGLFGHFVLTVLLICVVAIVQLSMNIFVQARAFNQHSQTTNIDFLNNFTDVSNGLYHSCGLTTTGDVYCWGLNTSGQLGNGTLIDSTVPVAVTMPAGVTFSTIDVGDSHSCALTSLGNAYCWGNNQTVQIGDGSQTNRTIPTAVTMPTDVTFVTISAGGYQTCALSSINTAYCWGLYRARMSIYEPIFSATPALVNLPSGITSVTSIDVGFAHVCLITNMGTAYCGGYNFSGSLGTGSSAEWSDISAVLLPSDATASHISAGRYHTCAVTTNGALYCWGNNENGTLGDGTSVDSNRPISVFLESAISFTSVTAGFGNTCATDTMNTIYCWGYNEFGQLGTFNTSTYIIPSPISTLNDQTITHISLGTFHTCASTESGRVFCWGANEKGQLGDGTTTPNIYAARVGASLIPTSVATHTPTFTPTPKPSTDYLSDFVKISSSTSHSCALTDAGIAYCWGLNSYGQLGNITTLKATVPVPVKMPTGIVFTNITTRDGQTCAIATIGDVYCWGNGRPIPGQIAMPDASALIDVSRGYSHICTLTTSGNAYCWGSNYYGELGIGVSTELDGSANNYPNPVLVSMPSNTTFTQISAANRHTCAISSTGSLYCWGLNDYGQVGNGTNLNVVSPTEVMLPAGVTFTKVDTGDNFTCALASNQRLHCWGVNNSNQLGNGTFVEAYDPTEVTAIGSIDIVDFDVGIAHVCVLTVTDKTYCWGASESGQLGAETENTIAVEVSTPPGTSFSSMSLGANHTCAISTSRQAYCWGLNTHGQLGDGTVVNNHQPQLVGGIISTPETPTHTHTSTPSYTATSTPTKSSTRTPTKSSTRTPTKSSTRTPTKSSTRTPTRTITRSRTRTVTSTPTRIKTSTLTKSPTKPRVPSRTPSRTK